MFARKTPYPIKTGTELIKESIRYAPARGPQSASGATGAP
jgi:hypothetical protein